MPYGGGGKRSNLAVTALILGVLAGIGGFFLFSYEACDAMVFGTCIQSSKPYESVGMLLMAFGGVLFIVGIILFAMAERDTPQVVVQQPAPPTTGYVKCSGCGGENYPGTKFCSWCGKPLT